MRHLYRHQETKCTVRPQGEGGRNRRKRFSRGSQEVGGSPKISFKVGSPKIFSWSPFDLKYAQINFFSFVRRNSLTRSFTIFRQNFYHLGKPSNSIYREISDIMFESLSEIHFGRNAEI